jgi:cysteinyl-tRNA synthetase
LSNADRPFFKSHRRCRPGDRSGANRTNVAPEFVKAPDVTAIQLHDTAARKKRAFVPQDPSRVTMYVCGPTVYSTAHIGNFRPAITFDVLYRLLRHEYGADHVVYARNITDVDDKINAAAAAEGVDISVITQRFATIYREDSTALNILPPTIEPAATAYMSQMITLTEQLVEGGFAYAAEGHVLFDVTAYEQYGALSKRSLDDMIAGARVEVAPYKRNPADFVLWKPSKPGEPVWDSPFGPGRPGWHLECSAMIEATLGQTIDIHGGGADLVFPHHENEIAQSACAHGGAALANYWLHNGFLSIDAEKMSKSLGNIVKPHELLERGVKGEVIRYAMLTGHYRAPLDWNDTLIERAQKSLDRLYGVLRRFGGDAQPGEAPEAVLKALRDDMNTPKALAALFEIAGRANKAESDDARTAAVGELKAAGDLLGLFQEDADAWFGLKDIPVQYKQDVDAVLAERAKAKSARDFEKADQIRGSLEDVGLVIEDTPEGAAWRLRSTEAVLIREVCQFLKGEAGTLQIPAHNNGVSADAVVWQDHESKPWLVEAKARVSTPSFLISIAEQASGLAGAFETDRFVIPLWDTEEMRKLVSKVRLMREVGGVVAFVAGRGRVDLVSLKAP